MHFRINIQISRTPVFLSAMITFWFFERPFLTLYQDSFLYMYLRTSWSAVTVDVVREITALLFEVPPNVIPKTTQTTTFLLLWEGQERVTDSSPVHLLHYRLLPKHQRFKKRYSNIRCSNYHNTGIDGNLKRNTKRRSALCSS